MRGARVAAVVAALALVAGCVENTAPGNDREAELDPPSPPAEVASAGSALAGVAPGSVKPEIMTDADLRNAPEVRDRCVYRFTEVGLPVLLYGSSAVLKLNGKLVPLPRVADGRYAADGVEVTVRPLDAEAGAGDELFETEFVLRLPGAPDELGFHGFSVCGS